MKVNILTIRRSLLLFLTAISMSILSPAMGDEIEALSNIQTVAEEFARAQVNDSGLSDIQVEAAKLDQRLKLTKCETPLEAFSNNASTRVARTTVGVKCTGEKPWTLYVPITINAMAETVITSRPILRGEALVTDMLEIKKVPITKLPQNYLTSPHQLSGMEAARSLKEGTTLTLNAVRPRNLIKQGQEVVIIAESGGIRVQMAGTALKNGSQGDLIGVKSHSTGRRIEAEILNENTVTVKF